jgi:transglutaminase-like putative cysteine protease
MIITPTSDTRLTVRVGCLLRYTAASDTPLLLNLRPAEEPRQVVQQEKLVIGDNLPSEEFTDSHGNHIHRVLLRPGPTEIRHDALVSVWASADPHDHAGGEQTPIAALPPQFLRYTLPSRYCDSDRLLNFAWEKFREFPPGGQRVQAICNWVHSNIEYRFGSGRPDISASEVIARGYGVCRDFSHVVVALCRTLNIPARYATGHLPDIGWVDPGSPMDFHAYVQAFLGGCWCAYDARYNAPRIGRIRLACGLDAVDGAFSTIYGAADLTYFDVWAYQVRAGSVALGDPVDLTRRLDGSLEVTAG